MIDGPDRRLLTQLQKQGRRSNQDLASDIGISSSACWRRVRALEESGIITRYAALVDREKAGFSTSAILQVSLDIGYVILYTSSLSFLGLGAQPPTAEWGAMMTDARGFMREAWWFPTFPGLALGLTVLGFNLLGDGLRDWLDPRIGGRR